MARKSKTSKKGMAAKHVTTTPTASDSGITSDAVREQERAFQSGGRDTSAIGVDEKKTGFLDLAPELRNRIYAYAFCEDTTNLDAPKFPPLLRISRQIRSEARAHYFAETSFHVYTGSDLRIRARKRTRGDWSHQKKYKLNAGTIGLPCHVRNHLEYAASQDAFLRNIVVNVFEDCYVHYAQGRAKYTNNKVSAFRERLLVFTLALRLCGNASLEVTREESSFKDRWTFEPLDIGNAAAAVENLARMVIARKGFKGFTLDDLATILAGLCSSPEDIRKESFGLRDRRTNINYNDDVRDEDDDA